MTKMVSVWPVGLAGGLKFEGPICVGDSVKHWYAYWARDRKFQIDFAGMDNGMYCLYYSPIVLFYSTLACNVCYSGIVCQLYIVYTCMSSLSFNNNNNNVYFKWMWLSLLPTCTCTCTVPIVIHVSCWSVY